jgi:lysophospholipase L1-like esterase
LLIGIFLSGAIACSARAQAPATQPTTQGARRGGGARGPTPPQLMTPRDAQPYSPNDFSKVDPKLPTLIIAGDSTADNGPDAWHRGWAAPLIDYFDTTKINIVNRSRGGRSFRSFVREGLWDQLVANLKPGDYVMIQMGHNDGGDVSSPLGRADLPGLGDETQEVAGRDGKTEVVHTFGWYARKWIRDVRDKGAIPVVMSQTVYNRWNNGKYARSEPNIFKWAKQTAEQEKVQFLDHTNIIADRYEKLGKDAVRPYFAADPLHTTTYGAVVNAELFIAGLKQLDIKPLVEALNDNGKAIEVYQPANP